MKVTRSFIRIKPTLYKSHSTEQENRVFGIRFGLTDTSTPDYNIKQIKRQPKGRNSNLKIPTLKQNTIY